jgi:DNA-binding MurR/RpiR family transcriptional regulator
MNSKTENAVDLNQIIGERFGQLTKSEKHIANYLLENQDESAFLAAAELAERLELSEATIVRFARTLGFESYPALRVALQEKFRQRVTHSARIRSRLDNLLVEGDLFERIVVSEIEYMTQALETVDREALRQAVQLLRSQERTFVFGVGPSTSLVELMDIRLTRFGHQVIPLTTAGREILEPLLLMTGRDVLFVIAFFDISPALQLVLDYASEVQCPVILLTDTLASIIGDLAQIVLEAKRGPVSEFHSLVVPMTIINTLLLALADEEQVQVLASLDKLDKLRDRLAKK